MPQGRPTITENNSPAPLVPDVRFRQFSTNHNPREDEDPRRQGAQHGRIRDADRAGAQSLDGAEGAEERVVDLAGVVGAAHGGGRIIATPPLDAG